MDEWWINLKLIKPPWALSSYRYRERQKDPVTIGLSNRPLKGLHLHAFGNSTTPKKALDLALKEAELLEKKHGKGSNIGD